MDPIRNAIVLQTSEPAMVRYAVEMAADLLKAGEVVALPTETVYGLAANALDFQAVQRIFQIKGRPAVNPIIVHVSDLMMARHCAAGWPDAADELAHAFWPGPLTLVLARGEIIPSNVVAGGDTVAVRLPAHPIFRAVISECGFPLAAPSANLSEQVSPTTAAHVRKALGNRIPLIVDGGSSAVGIESTVLDLTSEPPRILRPGMIGISSISAVVGDVQGFGSVKGHLAASAGSLKSPGMLEKHYSPNARVIELGWSSDRELISKLRSLGVVLSQAHVLCHSMIPTSSSFARVSVVPQDAQAFARALYAELHRSDELGANFVIVEKIPGEDEWHGIADRIRRAAAESDRLMPIQ